MNLTKAKLEQYLMQGNAMKKLAKSTNSSNNQTSLLSKQLRETKKLLDKINS